MISDNYTHLSHVPRLTRIRESTQHPYARKAHAEHPITECSSAVGTSSVYVPLMSRLLLLLGKPSPSVRAHLCAHLHGLTVNGCVDTERGRRIQWVGRECGGRTRLKRLRDRCLGTVSIVGKCVTSRNVGARISWYGKTIGGGRAVE